MGFKKLISTALIGLLYLTGVECTCSSVYPNIQEDKVATMCKSSVVQGVDGADVYIDTDLGATTTLGKGTACSCTVQTQRGKRLSLGTIFSGAPNTKCGTSVEFGGGAFGSTQIGVRCYSYQFEAETHTYTDLSVSLRKEIESYPSASSPYCVRLSLKYCNDNQHQCGDGTCIPSLARCDSVPDCMDESDEIGCSSITCGEGLIACDNNAFCIDSADRCDGVYQCPDQSDELPKYCDPGSTDSDSSSGTSGGLPPPLITVTCKESQFLPKPTTTSTTTTPETTSTTSTTTSTTTTTPTTTTTTPTTTTTTPSTTSSTTTTMPTTTTTTTIPTTTTTTTTSTTTSTLTTTSTSTTPSTTSTTSTTPSTSTASSSSTTTTTTPISTTTSTTTSTTPTTTTTTSTSTTSSTTRTRPTSTTVTTPTKTTPTSTSTTTATPTETTSTTTSTTSPTETAPPTTRSSTASTTTATESTSTLASIRTKTSKATSPTTTTTTTTEPTTATPTTTSTTTTSTSTTTTQPTTTQTTTQAPRCNGSSQFECGNGSCIPLKWRCDSLEDCNDKSDETGCSTFVCGENMFLCDERRICIKSSERCDGEYQCPDLSDELPKYCGSSTEKAPVKEDDDSTKIAIIIGIICGALFLIMMSGCIVYWVRTKNWNRRADRYAMNQQQSEKSVSPYSAYSAPTLHIVPITKENPTHVWYPSTSGKDQLSDLYVVEQIDGNAGDKHMILPQ